MRERDTLWLRFHQARQRLMAAHQAGEPGSDQWRELEAAQRELDAELQKDLERAEAIGVDGKPASRLSRALFKVVSVGTPALDSLERELSAARETHADMLASVEVREKQARAKQGEAAPSKTTQRESNRAQLEKAQREAKLRKLLAAPGGRGRSLLDLAHELGVNERTIRRYRRAIEKEA